MTGLGREAVVLIAGTRWSGVPGTDHRLAKALSELIPVLWVDPVVPAAGTTAAADRPPLIPGYAVDELAPRLFRLRTLGPPGFTRPGIRHGAVLLVHRALRAALASGPTRVRAILLMSGRDGFPSRTGGTRILHVTDDWPGGAQLMGLRRGVVERTLRANIAAADVVCSVSPGLRETLERLGAGPVHVVPNGCPLPGPESAPRREGRPVAGLLGQLNERLDMDLLESVAATCRVEVVGPITARDPRTVQRLRAFLRGEHVTWLGELGTAQALAAVGGWAVGLTPYRDDPFNRASFPLKTLEYLAVGVPAVSTDLPASRWLNTPWVHVADSAEHFVDLVAQALEAPVRADDVAARKRFAAQHTWDSRAAELLGWAEVTA